MNTAVAEQLITSNPCVVRARPARQRSTRAARPELTILVEHMPDRLRLAVLIVSWCGLRYGETAELRRGTSILTSR